MSKAGAIHRFHGGAGMASSTENVAYNERKIICFQEKRKIAKRVAQQIPDHASLFINIGTTTEAIAQALTPPQTPQDHHQQSECRPTILSSNENFEVIVAGGLVRHRDGGLIGEATIDFIQQFKVDYGIIGISGIDLDGTLLDFDYREVRAARAIIDNSRKSFPGRGPYQIRPQMPWFAWATYLRNRQLVYRSTAAAEPGGYYDHSRSEALRGLRARAKITS